jgi:hypothetical protein
MLKEMVTYTVGKNWLNIKQAIFEAAHEGIRHKPIKRKTWIIT